MNTSTESLQPGQQSASSASKPLWAAVGILGAAVLAMGATMIYQQRTPAPVVPLAQVALATPQVPAPAASASAADDLIEKPVTAPAKPAPVPVPVKKVVKPVRKPAPMVAESPAPAPVYAGASPAPYPSQAPVVVAQACTFCGSIESVTPVQRSTKPAGVGIGTVAGGVLGAVVGNQVGQGNGRTVATILGAIGGGFAGNAVEKNVRIETVYQVGVRMEDGSRRTVEVAQPPSVGSRVTVEGSSLRANDGVTYRAPAPVAQVSGQQQPVNLGR
jgi:outer membrane lipoprotein SlyB